MVKWTLLHPKATMAHLGMLAHFLSESDPNPAANQLHRHYSYGGGWRPQKGFTMSGAGLCYPGDPPLRPIAEAIIRDETVRLFESSFVAVIQPDGSFETCRMD